MCLIPSIRQLYGRSKQFIFQQDGAPAHTAKSIKEYFLQKKINVIPWCPRSPDLNPIENIWSWIDNQLTYHQIQSTEHLKQLLNEYWLKVPREMCMKLVESMQKRVYLCYKNKGGHFKY